MLPAGSDSPLPRTCIEARWTDSVDLTRNSNDNQEHMLTKRVALLATFNESANASGTAPTKTSMHEDPCLWRVINDGSIFLDWQIRKLKRLGLKPFVVLGQNGDHLLSVSQEIHDLDMVFDASPESTLATQLWSSLADAESHLFILPISTPCPEHCYWAELDQAAHALKEGSSQLVYGKKSSFFLTPLGSSKVGWPFLIPKKAIPFLRDGGSEKALAAATEDGLAIETKAESEVFLSLTNKESFYLWNKAADLTTVSPPPIT
jgi:hypothetical protein